MSIIVLSVIVFLLLLIWYPYLRKYFQNTPETECEKTLDIKVGDHFIMYRKSKDEKDNRIVYINKILAKLIKVEDNDSIYTVAQYKYTYLDVKTNILYTFLGPKTLKYNNETPFQPIIEKEKLELL